LINLIYKISNLNIEFYLDKTSNTVREFLKNKPVPH